MVIIFLIQFSLPCQGSFTPLCFNFLFYNPSFYYAEEPKVIESSESKTVFSPILIAGSNPQYDKVTEEVSQETKISKKENLA